MLVERVVEVDWVAGPHCPSSKLSQPLQSVNHDPIRSVVNSKVRLEVFDMTGRCIHGWRINAARPVGPGHDSLRHIYPAKSISAIFGPRISLKPGGLHCSNKAELSSPLI